MLEGLVTWILKTYIGKYVNVNQEKLSIGLLSGVVELENASLKLDAINENNRFPFSIKFGHIGKIKLNVSWNALSYTPWSLIAENICIIVGPKLSCRSTSKNEDSDETLRLGEKADQLVNAENKWFKEVELLGIDDYAQSNGPYLASLAYSILSNLHVSLNGLHIRLFFFIMLLLFHLYCFIYADQSKYLHNFFSHFAFKAKY